MTPYEFIHGDAPNMEYIRIFGCKAYVRIPRENICKDWSDRSKVGFLVGYSEIPLGIIYIPDTGTCITSLHVRCNEDIPDNMIECFQELKNEMQNQRKKCRGLLVFDGDKAY
jgi:hypothetical protein